MHGGVSGRGGRDSGAAVGLSPHQSLRALHVLSAMLSPMLLVGEPAFASDHAAVSELLAVPVPLLLELLLF
jgi:hypothetical protein